MVHNRYSQKIFAQHCLTFYLAAFSKAMSSGDHVATSPLMTPKGYGTYMAILGLLEFLVPLTSVGLLPTLRKFVPEIATTGNMDQLTGFISKVLA